MYCSNCFFFRGDGLCKCPDSRKREVGYFQKPCSHFELLDDKRDQIEQKVPEIEQKQPIIEQTMSKENDPTPPEVQQALDSVKRTCADCGRELPITAFGKNAYGYTKYCKDCMKKRQKAGKAKLPEGTPEQHLMEAILGPDYKADKDAKFDEMLLASIPSVILTAELKRRGYHGKLSRTVEIEI